jgi:small subunit ribosomal protein S4
MGLPIKHRKKYLSHKKRWDKEIISEEKVLITDYALKNKNEIRKIEFLISKYKTIAKEFNKTEESKNSGEAKLFIEALKKKGFLNSDASSLDEVLDIKIRDILERRLSNIVYRLKYAKTPKQARQFVVHKHVSIGDKVISSPSYLVNLEEEIRIEFRETSALFDENHPERKTEIEGIEEEIKEQEEREKIAKEKHLNEGTKFEVKEEILENEEVEEIKNE